MEMKATHKLKSTNSNSEWLLKCTGDAHYWCKISGEFADGVWRGPANCSVSAAFWAEDKNFKLIKLAKFKGNK